MHMDENDSPTCEGARWSAYMTVSTFGAYDDQGYRAYGDGSLDNQSFMLGDTYYTVTQIYYGHERTNYPTTIGRWYFPASYHFAVTEFPFDPGKLEDLTLYVGDVRLPLSSVDSHSTQGFGEAYRWGWSNRRWTEGMERSPYDNTFDYRDGDKVMVCLTDTAPIVTLVLTPDSITESGSTNSSTVTATIEQAVDTEFTVTVSAEAVSPAVAGDFTISTNKVLTFPADSTTSTGTVTITAVNNDVDAPDKTVTVKGEISDGARPADPDDVTLTITDDDDPPEFSLSDVTVTEGTAAEFEVSLSEASGYEVEVTYATEDGTAAQPGDYTTASGTLTFAAGDTEKTVTVSTVNDAVVEAGGETFTLKLSSPVNATLSGGASEQTATGTINDNDALDLTVELSADEIAEAGGQSTVTVRTGGVTYADDQTITLELSGTATETDDYTVSAKTLTLGAGDSSVTATVTAEQDSLVEGSESVEIKAKNGTVTSAAQTLMISDDDAVTVSVAGPDANVEEGDAAEFTVTVAGATRTAAVEVSYAVDTTASTASAGTDYTAPSATVLTIAAAETSGTIEIATLTDTVLEPDETLVLKLTAVSTAGDASVTTASATATIEDTGTVTVAAQNASATEGDSVQFTVALSGEVSSDVVVSYATADGTAVSGTDYTGVTATTLTITAGDTAKTVTVATTGDALNEADETFTVGLTVPDGVTLPDGVVVGADATGTIEDDDAVTVSVAGPDANVEEGDAAEFTVTVAGATRTAAVEVSYEVDTTASTASAGTDYTAPSATVLTIAAAETSGTIEIATLTDTVLEPDETLVLKLTAVSTAGDASVTTASATATIEDTGTVTVSVAGRECARATG